MAERLNGKVALVTGAGSGIGRAAALALASEGARVVLADICGETCDTTARAIAEAGGQALPVRCDVSVAADVEALVRDTLQTFGGLDCAFNNAGVEGAEASVDEYTEEDWDRTIATNLKGVWLCMKHEIPPMLERGGGAIVNGGSVASLIAFDGLAAYVTSKHGILGLTKTAALEYAERGIRVNAVCPGVVRTPMIDRFTGGSPEAEARFVAVEPMRRMGEPEEVARAVVWLCSDDASFVTGHGLVVDGGLVAR